MTGPFVLDASMTLSWAFEGESTPFTVAVLKSLETVHAIAPALWAFEVASVLSIAEREGLPLATLDDDLRRAASAAGVALVGAV